MFVLRKILKLLLLPVAFVLFFTRWALETSVKLTEWAVGLLTLIVGAAIIYSIVIHRLSLIHISEPTRLQRSSRMPSSA